jgi:hypothetical protein
MQALRRQQPEVHQKVQMKGIETHALRHSEETSTMFKATRNILVCTTLICALAPVAQGQASLNLPTPREHYKTYNVERAGIELMGKVIKDFGPQILMHVELLDYRGNTENLPPTESEELLKRGRDAGLESMVKVWNDFDPQTRNRIVEFLRSGAEVGGSMRMKPEVVVRLVRVAGLAKYKADILEILWRPAWREHYAAQG